MTWGLILGAAGLIVVAMFLIWRTLYRQHEEARFQPEMEEALRQIFEKHQFDHVVKRHLFGASILWARQHDELIETTIEVGQDLALSYVRISCEFEQPLRQEMQVLGEKNAKVWEGWWGMVPQEVDESSGLKGQVVFLARGAERPQALAASPLRHQLLKLCDSVEDFKWTDDEIYVRLDAIPEDLGELDLLVGGMLEFARHVLTWCEAVGPLQSAGQVNYQEELSQMDLSVTRATKTNMKAIDPEASLGDSTSESMPPEFALDVAEENEERAQGE